MNYIKPNHITSLKSFDKWVKANSFNEGVFSTKHHVIEAENTITIDKGRMILQFKELGVNLIDVSMGAKMVVVKSASSLEKVLMQGLQWAVERHFINTYNGHSEENQPNNTEGKPRASEVGKNNSVKEG